jgi:hypothetical protein
MADAVDAGSVNGARGIRGTAMTALIKHLYGDDCPIEGDDVPTCKDVFRTCVHLLTVGVTGENGHRDARTVTCAQWAACMRGLLETTGVMTRVAYVDSDVRDVTFPDDFAEAPDELPLSAYTVTVPTTVEGHGMQLRFALVASIE